MSSSTSHEAGAMTGARPILAEPDQRYWRRRANRRVRKARLTRSLGNWLVVAMALLIIGVALFRAGAHALDGVRNMAGLAIHTIEVDGAHASRQQAIRSRLAGFLGENIIDLNLYEVAAVARSDPWVLQASAKRVLPGTLRVTVAERRPCAVATIDDQPWVVDDTGYIVTRGRIEGLPVLTGMDGLEGERLVRSLLRGVQSIERLERHADPWVREIAEMDFSRGDRVAVHTLDPGPTILLDPGRVERNVNMYLELRGEIARRVGSLDSVDLRWQDRISVMPKANIPLKEDG